jgi:hypothetical protein
MTNPQPLLGKRASDVKVAPIAAEDAFAETPIFAPGIVENETQYLKSWPANEMLAGNLKALRRTKNEDPDEQRDYACIETVDGVRFRVYTPGQLKYALSQITLGTYVEMTYMGKEKVEGYKTQLHQFKVEAASPSALN